MICSVANGESLEIRNAPILRETVFSLPTPVYYSALLPIIESLLVPAIVILLRLGMHRLEGAQPGSSEYPETAPIILSAAYTFGTTALDPCRDFILSLKGP